MEPMNILTSQNVDSYHWKQSTITWNDILLWMMEPASEKANGGFVLGTFQETTVKHSGRECTGLHRRNGGLVSRDALVLDADFPKTGEELLSDVESLGLKSLSYTTFSHTEEKPRYRIIIPFSRPSTEAEYRATANQIMEKLGKENFDPGSDQPERCMFFPATPDGGMVEFKTTDGDLLQPTLVQPGAELAAALDHIKRDPFTLPGTTGAFNRLNPDLNGLIEKYALPYEEESAGRWRYRGTQSAAGVSEVSPGLWWSSHETDPASGHAQTAFDLVRIHTFGEYDSKAGPDTPVYDLPSQKKAVALLEKDEDVAREMYEHDFGPKSIPAQLGYDPDSLSDGDLARNLAERGLYKKFLYVENRGWLNWVGTHWEDCNDRRLWDPIYEEIRNLVAEWASIGKSARAIADLKKCVDATKTRRLVDTMSSFLVIQSHHLDAEHDLLNCANGTVDLRTGELRKHSREDYLTALSDIQYVPGATHADWDKVLGAIRPDALEWMQYRCGQAATGWRVPDDVVPILQGGGANGKTTFTGAILSALGGYGRILSERAIFNSQGDHPTELMSLQGARFALLEETPEGVPLNVKRMKDVLGAAHITARRMRQDEETFVTTHSMFMTTNYHPKITETDEGTWRRLALVDFPYTYRPGAEGENARPADPHLRNRMEESPTGQLEAVLAWLVEGAKMWYAENRVLPDFPSSVAENMRVWRAASDPLQDYVSNQLEKDAGSAVHVRDLYEDFAEWQMNEGHPLWNERTFANRFRQHEGVKSLGITDERMSPSSKKELRTLSRRDQMEPIPTGQIRVWSGIRFA